MCTTIFGELIFSCDVCDILPKMRVVRTWLELRDKGQQGLVGIQENSELGGPTTLPA